MLLLNKSCRRSGLFRTAAAGRLVHSRNSPLSACMPEEDERPGAGDRKVFPPKGSVPARAGRRGSPPLLSRHHDEKSRFHVSYLSGQPFSACASGKPAGRIDCRTPHLLGRRGTAAAFSAALGRPSEQCRPFFCLETAWEKGQPKLPAHIKKLRCLTFAEQQGWIWKNEGLTERTIRRHVQERARALRVPFEEDAFEQFCASVPADANAVENELSKLRLMLDAEEEKKPPEPPRVTAALLGGTGWSPESNVFACIRHMEAGNLSAVWKELGRSRHDPEGLFFPLLSLLARDVRLLWQCRMGENVRMHPSEAAFKQQLAARLGAAGLAELMSMIMDAEWQVKSGRRSVEQSLDMLAADVTDLCARAR